MSTDSTASKRPVHSSHSLTCFPTAFTTLTGRGAASLVAVRSLRLRRINANPAPGGDKAISISGINGNGEHGHGDDSQSNRRRETMEWKEKSGHCCSHGCDQKPLRPPIETVAGDQSNQNHEPGKDCDQTDQ